MRLSIPRAHAHTLLYEFRSNDIVIDDISNWDFWFTVKDNIEDTDADAKIKKTTVDMAITNNSASDPVVLNVSLSETDTDIELGEYFYDLWFRRGVGEPTINVESAKIRITQPVTRSFV